MDKQKITILSHDLSWNCLGRAYILAKALEPKYDVNIIGPMRGKGLWAPVADDTSISYTAFGRTPNPFKLIKAIKGEIIYAIKPRTASFGYALLAKLFTGKKIVLDIDDWEMGFVKDSPFFNRIKDGIRFWEIDNVFYTWLMDRCIHFADAVTVSNTFLQHRFGGTLIPHFRDTDAFDPAKFDRDAMRKNLDVENKKVVMFFGTIRQHKGIETLIGAFDILKRIDVVLVLVGVDDKAKKILPEREYLKIVAPQPFVRVPEFLAAADIIALMQNQSSNAAKGQLPAKIFDAMSMGKPVISTNISDIPRILNDCGVIINDNPQELAEAITTIIDNPDKAKAMGLRAREKCIEQYSYQAVRPVLTEVFENIVRSEPKTKIK